MAGRHAHLVQAIARDRNGLQDTVLEARLTAMRLWNKVRFVVLVLLSIGLSATVGGWLARYLPEIEPALDAINRFTALVGALSGLLTLVYLFLNRLLGQLEADILCILTLKNRK